MNSEKIDFPQSKIKECIIAVKAILKIEASCSTHVVSNKLHMLYLFCLIHANFVQLIISQ